ncbi:hypothetical protein STAQ_00950 [Allostella sp. ATCC 35155]|nr:hypothetical protein STAQ_00950 [Stella sp. ATCC 35155]
MANIAATTRRAHGPSLDGPETVTIVAVDAPRMDAAWRARWRRLAAMIGPSALPPDTSDDPARAVAAATEALAAAALDREPAAVRSSAEPGAYVLPDMPPAIAERAAGIVSATAGLACSETVPQAEIERLRQATGRLYRLARSQPAPPARRVDGVVAGAAERLGIPWGWSTTQPGLIRIGEGRHLTLLDGASPMDRPVMGSQLAASKPAMKRYLAGFGLPVLPDRIARREEEAAAAAAELGYPVAVKPVDGSRARGVTLDVRKAEEMPDAFGRARSEGSAVMIEPYLDLPDFRAIMVGTQVVNVLRRDPPYLTGNGRTDIAGLLAEHNRAVTEQRAAFPAHYPVTVDFDVEQTLRRSGRSLETVPAVGEQVILRRLPMRDLGAYGTDATAEAHPRTLALFARLASITGMACCAIDFRAEDIGQAWDAQRFAIFEYNARPDIGIFAGHPLVATLLRSIAPDLEAIRLPTLLIVGDEPAVLASALRDEFACRGLPAAVATADDLALADIRVAIEPGSAHRRMIEDPTLAVAVHCRTAADVARFGLGVAVIDIAHLAEPGAGAMARGDEAPTVRLEAEAIALVRSRARRTRDCPAIDMAAVAADVALLAAAPARPRGLSS